jgi:hypothetical protein
MTYTPETRSNTGELRGPRNNWDESTEENLRQNILVRVRSEDIRWICKVEEINTWVKRRKSEWNDHINRLKNTVLWEQREIRIQQDEEALDNHVKDGMTI